MTAKRVFLSVFCAVAALAACAESKILWEASVSDAEDALIIVGDVRDGAALVVGPLSNQEQFEGLADEFGPSGVPSLGKNQEGHWTLELRGCKDWERPGFSPFGKEHGVVMLRLGRGLVVLTAFDGRKSDKFKEGLARELALQNAGVAFRGVTFVNATGKRVGKLARGDGKVELSFLNLTDAPATVSAELVVESAAGKRTFTGEASGIKKGAFKVAVPGDFLAYGPTTASMSFTEKKNGKTYVAGKWSLDWPEYFSVVLPEYRGMVSTARREAAVHLGARFDDARKESFAGRDADIEITGPDGAKIAAFKKTFSESPRLSFDAPLEQDAAIGTYKVAVRSTDASGKQIRAEGSFKIVPVRPGQVFVDQDGVLLADGKPWYPFGIYHLAGRDNIIAAAEMGLDLAQLWSGSKENLEALKEFGIRLVYETEAWGQVINTFVNGSGYIPEVYDFETNANFRARAELVRDNPAALAFYYTSDEGDPPVLPGIKHVRDYWEKLDPEDHPTYLVATRDPAMSAGADIIGVDCYPRSFGAKRPMTSISDLIEKFNAQLPGRCIIAVPESFGHSGKHQETPDECKCMAYLSMVHGAKGVFWYCWWDSGNQGACADAETRRAITEVTTEAKDFKLALLVPGGQVVKSVDGRVHARLCGDDATGRFLIAVNGTDDPSDGVIESPALKGQALEPLHGSPAVQPDAAGRLATPFAPCARAIWRVK
jgi:hypothetical protein